MPTVRIVILVVGLLVAAASCGTLEEPAGRDEAEPLEASPSVSASGEGLSDGNEIGSSAGDSRATDCLPEAVGEEDGPVEVIYTVVRGQLESVCYGEPSSIAEEGWDALAEVAPPEQLDAVSLYAEFRSENDTLAFAGPVDDDFDRFVIAVDRETAADDPEELRLTMLHEFAHVFTQTSDQLDLDVGLAGCETYWNGAGCFRSGSFIADWVAEFWTAEQLESLPIKGGIDEDGGELRCNLDTSFLGAYAASHPEEDFAESFSAYVFGVEVPDDVNTKMAFFEGRPELAAFADRAAAADREGLNNNFERCG
ncbi:MAG: hypothetical protein ACI8TP_004110 [Acidimicrobiales bacterium]